MRARWRRELDRKEITVRDVMKTLGASEEEMLAAEFSVSEHATPAEGMAALEEATQERPDRVNDLTVNDRADSAALSGTIPTEVRN